MEPPCLAQRHLRSLVKFFDAKKLASVAAYWFHSTVDCVPRLCLRAASAAQWTPYWLVFHGFPVWVLLTSIFEHLYPNLKSRAPFSNGGSKPGTNKLLARYI